MLLAPRICNDRHEAMSYSLVEAATACGVNRSTVLRAIRAGKISAGKDEQGEWRIEAVELHRVYPPVQTHEAHPEQAHQDALIAELRTALADMRRGRDQWREQAHRLALLAPKAEPVQPKPEPAHLVVTIRHSFRHTPRRRPRPPPQPFAGDRPGTRDHSR